MLLSQALAIQPYEVVAFSGAGGKTAALIQLAQELQAQDRRVIVTTTTHMAQAELRDFPRRVSVEVAGDAAMIAALLDEYRILFLYQHIWGGRVQGLNPEQISSLLAEIRPDALLIEADHARRRPLKAADPDLPRYPAETSLVVPIASLGAIGKPFNQKFVVNAPQISERYGFLPDQPIQAPWIAQILSDNRLGFGDAPNKARIAPLLNRVKGAMVDRLKARRTAQLILKNPRIERVLLGRLDDSAEPVLEVQRRVGALVLAGGLSSRMGRSKPLLPWGDKTVIETIVGRLLPLRLADIVVVTGHEALAVETVLTPYEVRSAYNKAYAKGEMLSSLQTGLAAFDTSISAALIFLGDQPQINPRLIHDMLSAYATGAGEIIAPSYRKRRGHPLLIGRRFWPQILALAEGQSLRDVLNTHADEIHYIITEDANILYDMDTPEDYQAALRRAGLL